MEHQDAHLRESASARLTFPRVTGRSSRRVANSLVVGMCDLLGLFSRNGKRGVPGKSKPCGFDLIEPRSYLRLTVESRFGCAAVSMAGGPARCRAQPVIAARLFSPRARVAKR